MVRLLSCLGLAAGVAAVPSAAQGPVAEEQFAHTLARVSQRVERWYRRAQSVVSRESVVIQPLRSDLTPAGFPRSLTFELRVGWEADPDSPDGPLVASVLRQPASFDGRPPRGDQEPGCMDPKPVSPEPLAMLLPERLRESEFSPAGESRIDGRQALRLDYRRVTAAPPSVTWAGECLSASLPGLTRGRVWVDAATHEVLRLDERLVGTFALDVPRDLVRRWSASRVVIERAESSIHYRYVEFQDPRETLMLPASVDTLTVIRGSVTQRVRMTQRFSDYRRFLTAGRILD